MGRESDKTRKNKTGYVVLSVIGAVLWLAPIGTFLFLALMEGELLYQKIALSMSLCIVIIMTLVSITTKIALRSRLWVMLIGVYVCLQNIMTPLIIFAACQIADELIVCPLKARFKRKYQINKEIDGRL